MLDYGGGILIWTVIENSMATIGACLPTFQPLYAHYPISSIRKCFPFNHYSKPQVSDSYRRAMGDQRLIDSMSALRHGTTSNRVPGEMIDAEEISGSEARPPSHSDSYDVWEDLTLLYCGVVVYYYPLRRVCNNMGSTPSHLRPRLFLKRTTSKELRMV